MVPVLAQLGRVNATLAGLEWDVKFLYVLVGHNAAIMGSALLNPKYQPASVTKIGWMKLVKLVVLMAL